MSNITVRVVWRKTTMHVTLDDANKLVAVNLGGDFLNVTDKLTPVERGQLITKAMIASGRM